MTRILAAAAALALLGALPAAAPAKKSSTPKVIKGSFKPYQADMENYAALSGKAKLVDTRKNDKLSIVRVRGLVPGAKYTFSLQEAAAGTNVCTGGTLVEAFGAKTFMASKKGRSATRHSRVRGAGKFAIDRAKDYAVVIRTEAGDAVMCANLKQKRRSASKKGASPKKGSGGKGKSRGRGPKG